MKISNFAFQHLLKTSNVLCFSPISVIDSNSRNVQFRYFVEADVSTAQLIRSSLFSQSCSPVGVLFSLLVAAGERGLPWIV
jgi:hypothetical protein